MIITIRRGPPLSAKPQHCERARHRFEGHEQADIERYNHTVRQEWLAQSNFESLEEAQGAATKWLWTYNKDRPNIGIGGITPAQKRKLAA